MTIPYQLALSLVGGTGGGRGPIIRFRRRRRGIDRCESVLERQLALAFAETLGFSHRTPADTPWVLGRWQGMSTILLSQALWGPYRTDFALVPVNWRCPAPLPLVIEIDGHEFHERTAEQAARDRSRDRFMTASGAAVLRYTGREIWRDARGCAEEVLAISARRLGAISANA